MEGERVVSLGWRTDQRSAHRARQPPDAAGQHAGHLRGPWAASTGNAAWIVTGLPAPCLAPSKPCAGTEAPVPDAVLEALGFVFVMQVPDFKALSAETRA